MSAPSPEMDVVDVIWLIFRKGIKDYIDAGGPKTYSGEADYRAQCEKAGLVAVANFLGKAYRT